MPVMEFRISVTCPPYGPAKLTRTEYMADGKNSNVYVDPVGQYNTPFEANKKYNEIVSVIINSKYWHITEVKEAGPIRYVNCRPDEAYNWGILWSKSLND